MNFIVQAILPFILLYKYWALFGITFLAAFVLPIPAGTLLVASAAFASKGYFNIYLLILVVTVANIAGDNCAYFMARSYGKKVLYRIGFVKRILTSKQVRLIEKVIRKKPGFVIFVTRFEVMATLTANLMSGLSEVPYKKFLFFEILGAIASVLFYALLGYFFGNSWEAVNRVIGNFTIVFFLLIIIAVALFWKRIINNLDK